MKVWLDFAEHYQDDKDQQDKPYSAAGAKAPGPAMRPDRDHSHERQYENNE